MITGIVIVVVIGLIAGLILSVASIVFAVPVDEKQEQTAAPADFPDATAMQRLWRKVLLKSACVLPAARMWLRSAPGFLERIRHLWKRKWLLCGAQAITIMYPKR